MNLDLATVLGRGSTELAAVRGASMGAGSANLILILILIRLGSAIPQAGKVDVDKRVRSCG